MNILITGGAGYIGSVLTPLLLAEGHQVTVLDNFMYDQNSLLDVVAHKKLRLLRADKVISENDYASGSSIVNPNDHTDVDMVPDVYRGLVFLIGSAQKVL